MDAHERLALKARFKRSLHHRNVYILTPDKKKVKRDNMAKHCIYCKSGIDEKSVVDVCRRCGVGVWGEKMFQAIIDNMEGHRDSGDLFQGSVTESSSTIAKVTKF